MGYKREESLFIRNILKFCLARDNNGAAVRDLTGMKKAGFCGEAAVAARTDGKA